MLSCDISLMQMPQTFQIINVGSDNVLLLFGKMPLPEPILTTMKPII